MNKLNKLFESVRKEGFLEIPDMYETKIKSIGIKYSKTPNDTLIVSDVDVIKKKLNELKIPFFGESLKKEDVDSSGIEIRIGAEPYQGKFHVTVFGGKGFARSGNLYQRSNFYKSFDNEQDANAYVKELEKKFGVKKESLKKENITLAQAQVGNSVIDKKGRKGEITRIGRGLIEIEWDDGGVSLIDRMDKDVSLLLESLKKEYRGVCANCGKITNVDEYSYLTRGRDPTSERDVELCDACARDAGFKERIEKLHKSIVTPLPESEADPKELALGVEVEMEHTTDREEAKKIALQHLAETKNYYTKLKKYVEQNKQVRYMNPYTGQIVDGIKDLDKTDHPPWLKGEWKKYDKRDYKDGSEVWIMMKHKESINKLNKLHESICKEDYLLTGDRVVITKGGQTRKGKILDRAGSELHGDLAYRVQLDEGKIIDAFSDWVRKESLKESDSSWLCPNCEHENDIEDKVCKRCNKARELINRKMVEVLTQADFNKNAKFVDALGGYYAIRIDGKTYTDKDVGKLADKLRQQGLLKETYLGDDKFKCDECGQILSAVGTMHVVNGQDYCDDCYKKTRNEKLNKLHKEVKVVKGDKRFYVGPLSYRSGYDIIEDDGKYYLRIMNGPFEIFRSKPFDDAKTAEVEGRKQCKQENPALARNTGIESLHKELVRKEARTIGASNITLVKNMTKKMLKQRKDPLTGETNYQGIDEEVINALPEELWDTWEAADQEIRRIIGDVTSAWSVGRESSNKEDIDEEPEDTYYPKGVVDTPQTARPYKKKKEDFTRDNDGKISDTILSNYGRMKLQQIQGVKLYFPDKTLTIRGDKLIDENGKVFDTINSDREVNKIIYKII